MSKIIKAEQLLKQQHVTTDTDSSDTDLDPNHKPVRGRIASGRFWKSPKRRTNSVVKTRGLKLSLQKKMQLREDLKRVKELSRAYTEERIQAKKERKQRREENLQRQAENNRKSEVVQVIKNTSKIKKMKKSQLRRIEKRDTSSMIN